MSDLTNIQFVDQAQLKQVMLANADKADRRYIKKSELNVNDIAFTDQLGELASKDEVGADDLNASLAATIEGKANAADVYTAAEVDSAVSDAIDSLGALASLNEVSEEELSSAVKNKINDVYTKAEVYTKDEAYSKDEVDSAIAAHVASVYKPAGSATIDTLPEPTEVNLGYVFNISEDGVSNENFVEGAGTKIVAGTNVVVVLAGEDTYKYDIFAGELDLSEYVKTEDIQVATSAQINDIILSIYQGEDLNPAPEVVDIVPTSTTSLGEIGAAFNDPAVTEVNATLNNDIVIPTREDGRISTTMIPAGKTVNLDLNGNTINCDAYAIYNQGGTVNLIGEGTIITRNLNTYGAIQSNGGTVNIGPGITIDTTQAEVPEGKSNWLYGVVLSGDAIANINGTIHTSEAATLSITNGTASGEGAQFNISGDAQLITDQSSAIYLADNKTVVIEDNAQISGGIIMRMGEVVIKDNAVVTQDFDWLDDTATFLVSSGCAALPGTVLMATGCYQSKTGSNDCSLTVKDNAKITSTNGEAIAVWKFDTLYDQKVDVVVENSANLTPAEGFDKIKVYEHDELAAIATAGGKTMKPKATETDLTITVDGSVVYPV